MLLSKHCPAALAAAGLSLAAVALLLAAAGNGLAADTAAGGKPAASTADSAKPAAPAAATRPDEAERKKIINSPQWHAMQYALKEWLSIQRVYTPSQLRKVKSDLNLKVARMSPQELVDFMEDMDAKLKILNGEEAEKARLWIEQRLAVQVNLTPEQLKRMRPDVLDISSDQLQLWLDQWQAKQQQIVASQKAFDKGKNLEIKNIEEMEKDEEHERDEALNRAYYDMANGSPYGGYYHGGSADKAGSYYGMYGRTYMPSWGYGGYRW